MSLIKYFVLILTAISITCQAEIVAKGSRSPSYNDFNHNPHLTNQMRRMMKPYILPAKHPVKVKLDALFLSKRVIENETTFREAGFITLHQKARSFIRVARHPSVPGYLFKIYLDTELREKLKKPGWM